MVTTSASPPIARAAHSSVSAARSVWRRLVPVLALLVGALALRLVLWNGAVGFEQGDPLEYVNIAYKLAFGIGIEWWDLRPLLLSLLYVPVLYVAQWWPDPTGEAMVKALRLTSVLFGVGVVGLTYLLGRQLGGEGVGLGAGLLVAVNPVVNRMSVSTFAELPSTFFILLSLWLLLRSVRAEAGQARWMAFGAGLAIGLGCMIRYQAIFYLLPVGLWVTVVALVRAAGGPIDRLRAALDPRSWSGALAVGFGGGLLLAVLVQGLIELIAYGRPFHSLLASFEYNVTSGLAPVEFGQEPFDWFLRQTPSWLGLMTAILAAIGLSALVRGRSVAGWRLVALTCLTMLLALSALPHKEERFMSQVVPLLALLAAQGAVLVGNVAGWAWHVRASTAKQQARGVGQFLTVVVAILGCAAPMLMASLRLDLESNVGYVAGVKRAAELRPGGTLGTIPWLVARPYAGTRLTLERMDRNVWSRRDEVARTIEQSDFLLFPEYWLLEDREIDRLVDARFRSIEAYEDGVVLYQSRRLEEPERRRPRS
jgi:4-amino-4-deoxy-L-arabinose transferase-like glycosyltransferase